MVDFSNLFRSILDQDKQETKAAFASQERQQKARAKANSLQISAERLKARSINKVLSSGLALQGSSIDQLTSILSRYAIQAEQHLLDAERKNAESKVLQQYDHANAFLSVF